MKKLMLFTFLITILSLSFSRSSYSSLLPLDQYAPNAPNSPQVLNVLKVLGPTVLNETGHQWFRDQSGNLSREKLYQLRQKNLQRWHELFQIAYDHERAEGEDREEARKKAMEKSNLICLQIMLSLLDRIEQIDQLPFGEQKNRQYEIASYMQQYIQLEGTFLRRAERKTLAQVGGAFRTLIREDHLIPRDPFKRPLPSNLVSGSSHGGSVFLSQEEMIRRIQQGQDLSLLDPPNSSFWRRPLHLPSINPHHDFNQGFAFSPDSTSFKFSEVVFSGHNPKIEVKEFKKDFMIGSRKIKSWRLKFDDEVNVEIAASKILKLLGYHADDFFYVKRPKIYFPSGYSVLQFREEWLSFYGSTARLDHLLAGQGQDAQGEYVIFHEASARANYEDEKRVGPFHWNKFGNNQLREVRGQLLAQAFFEGSDIKAAENNKIKLIKVKSSGSEVGEVPEASGEQHQWRMISLVSDVGNGFGRHILKNNPNDFSHQLIDPKDYSPESEEIKLKYHRYHYIDKPNPFLEANYTDVKWMARYLAQITRPQLAQILALAGWPLPIQRLLLEKLSHRRNDIVRTFELEKEGYALWPTVVPWPASNLKDFPSDAYIVKGELVKNFHDHKDHPQAFFPINYRKGILDLFHRKDKGSQGAEYEPEDLRILRRFGITHLHPLEKAQKVNNSSLPSLKMNMTKFAFLGDEANNQKAQVISVYKFSHRGTSASDFEKILHQLQTIIPVPGFFKLTPSLYIDQWYGKISGKVFVIRNEGAAEGRNLGVFMELAGEFLPLNERIQKIVWIK